MPCKWNPENGLVTFEGRKNYWFACADFSDCKLSGFSGSAHRRLRNLLISLNGTLPLKEVIQIFSLAPQFVTTMIKEFRQDNGKASYSYVLLERNRPSASTSNGFFLGKTPDGTWFDDLRSLCEKVFRVVITKGTNRELGVHLVIGGRTELVYETTIALERTINFLMNDPRIKCTTHRNKCVSSMVKRFNKYNANFLFCTPEILTINKDIVLELVSKNIIAPPN